MSENAIERPVTRRRLLAIGLAGGVSLLVGCGSATRSEAGWTFVDDRVHTVRLRQRPTRIVAYTTAAAALYDWGMYVAKFGDNGDLAFYAQRGVPLVSAKTSEPYWDKLPWKDAGKYPADAILYDARSGALPLRDAKGIPAFAELPAVRANQIAPWQGDPPPSYQTYTRTMNDLAKAIAGWHKVT